MSPAVSEYISVGSAANNELSEIVSTTFFTILFSLRRRKQPVGTRTFVKKTSLFLALGLSSAGLVSGLAARRMTRGTAVGVDGPAAVGTMSFSGARAPEAAISNVGKTTPIAIPPSTDTGEILLALNDATLYPRLAAWLLGAGERDIAAYWNGYRTARNRKTYIVDLIFINWTRLNPGGAIAAVAGTKDNHFPWWAWTAHDPQAALSAVLASAPGMVDRVARGIGEFHPDWLLEHLDQIPEANRAGALALFKEQNGTEDPLASLKFMRENALGDDPGTFKKLVQKDPWEALDWLEQNPSLLVGYESAKNPLDILLETMIHDHPDDLERFAAQLPPGFMRRKMEAAAFDRLLATDPSAAMAQANATESTLIAAQCFAKIGLSLAKTDPEQAFGILEKLWGDSSRGSSERVVVEYPGGSSAWGGYELIGTGELLEALAGKDPERLMQTDLETGRTVSSVAGLWASHDIVSYSKWVDQQTDSAIRESALRPLINRLKGMGQFSEAVDWTRGPGEAEKDMLGDIFRDWGRADPTDAASWLLASDLSAEQKAKFRGVIETERNR